MWTADCSVTLNRMTNGFKVLLSFRLLPSFLDFMTCNRLFLTHIHFVSGDLSAVLLVCYCSLATSDLSYSSTGEVSALWTRRAVFPNTSSLWSPCVQRAAAVLPPLLSLTVI